MALTPGTRLGPYEIVSAIGAGGMGEVYRATDNNLKRAVAIKVLPAAVAGDAARLARFQREAEALAALNHPNIAAIYGLEKTPDVTALVMELIEGEDLSRRIARGPIPIDDALPVAKQIADALEVAHEQGIIHRDLKPANIKVRADGTVKVLDFGLAKALVADAPSGAGGHTRTSTITSPAMLTGAGTILGTAPYMAPEQARGDAVDRRADIWAFGCVLFEMLTGRVAFGAATVTETLAKILEGHPDLNALPATTPPALRRLVRRCLERSIRSRLQHIGDARADIADILSGELVAEGARGVRAATKLWWLGALALSIAAAIVLIWQVAGGSAANTDELLVAITPPARSLPFEFALSPDGRHIVFVAPADRRRRLWLRSLANETITLPGTEDANYPFWSADSKSIGFFASGTLRRIDIAGGPPITLARAPLGRGGSWNRDGTIVFSPTGEGLVQIPAAEGGEPVSITRLNPPAETGHWWPQFLPDGRHFLFVVNGTQAGVYLGSVDGEMPRRLMPSDTAAAYLPPDMIVFARNRVLVARHFNTRTYEVSGPEHVVADAVGADATWRLGGFSVSATGRIAYQSVQALSRELAAFDRSGKPLGVLIGDRDGDQVQNPELSPRDLRVAVTLRVDNNVDIWLTDLQGGPLTKLTTDDDADAFPVWSPDARLIAFTSNRNRRIYVKPSSGPGEQELLLETPAPPESPEDWSPNNRYVLYRTFDQKPGADMWALDRFAKPRARIPVATSNFDERNGQFSPDGRWIAYETNRSGPSEVIVQSFPDGERVLQVSRAGGTQPRWSADQQEIYFVAPGGNLMAAPVSTTRDQGLRIGDPVNLFTTRIGEGGLRPQYDVTPDGRFLVAQTAESVSPLKLLLNWKPRP